MSLNLTSCGRDAEPKRCVCGGADYLPQHRMIRVPGTFLASVHHIFCMGGCHHEGVGMNYEQAVDAWNSIQGAST